MISEKAQALLLREAQGNFRSAATWLGRDDDEALDVAARSVAEAIQMVADALGDTPARRQWCEAIEEAAAHAKP